MLKKYILQKAKEPERPMINLSPSSFGHKRSVVSEMIIIKIGPKNYQDIET